MMYSCAYFIFPLWIGFFLDLLIGDPQWLPHPIRLNGAVISFLEKRFNSGRFRALKGGLVAVLLILTTWFVSDLLIRLVQPYLTLYYAISTLFVFYGLANRSLISEALKVVRELNRNGLYAGRKQLSFIVGRDTSNLSGQQILTALLETVAENLSDGVVAPLFFYAIGGVPLMMTYKMINTLDSMIGYKSERYKSFGMVAARIDDAANLVPARITAFLMPLIMASRRGFSFIFKYGNKHSSPNSGYPEAALAGILNCRFGGPNVYHGVLVEKPFIGNNSRIIQDLDLWKACVINLGVSFLSVSIITIYALLSKTL